MEPDSISEQDEQKNGRDRPDQKRFTRKKLCLLLVTVLVILMALFFYAVNIYHTPDLNELPARSKLAKLPESIKNLQVDTRPLIVENRAIPNQSELSIRFEAEPNDIDNFINNSPGIDKNSFRPLIPLTDSDNAPTWWSTDDSSGRMYTFRVRDDIDGMVAVYDDSNTVRIWAWYIVNPRLRDMQIAFEDIYDESVDFLEDVLHEVVDLFD
jgi:hypothetical protein